MANQKLGQLTARGIATRNDRVYLLGDDGVDYQALAAQIADLAVIPMSQVAGLDDALDALDAEKLDAGDIGTVTPRPAAAAGAAGASGKVADADHQHPYQSDAAQLNATGTTQAAAAQITTTAVSIVTTAGNTCVKLPLATPGAFCFASLNAAAVASANVYPTLGDKIGSFAVNVSVQISQDGTQAGFSILFFCAVEGVWNTIQNPRMTITVPPAIGGGIAGSAGGSAQSARSDHRHDLNNFVAEGAGAANGAVPSPGAAVSHPRILRAKGDWAPPNSPSLAPRIGDLWTGMQSLNNSVAANITAVQNAFFYPASIPEDMSFDRVVLFLGTAQTGAKVWMALYDYGGAYDPEGGALIADLGELDLSAGSGSMVTKTINLSVTKRELICGVFVPNVSVAPSIVSNQTEVYGMALSFFYVGNSRISGWLKAGGYVYPAAAPATVPTGLVTTGSNIPMVLLRRSA